MDRAKRHRGLSLRGWERETCGAIGREVLARAVRRGELPAYQIGRRLVVFENDFDAWLERRRVRAELPPARIALAAAERMMRRMG